MPAQNILLESFYQGPAFYGPRSEILTQNDDCTIFKMKNETGEGIMTRFPILPGIELLYNDMHMTIVRANQDKVPCVDVMEINHCREGRFECEFADGDAAYLGAGDLAVNMLTHPTRDSWFPLSHYHGISVMVDLRAAQDTLCQVSQVFGSAPIDPYALRNRLCGKDNCGSFRKQTRASPKLRDKWAIRTPASFLRCSASLLGPLLRSFGKFPVRLEQNPSCWSGKEIDSAVSSLVEK